MIEKAIFNILENNAGVAAILKGADAVPANRIRINGPAGIPQKWTLPAVYWERTSTDRVHSLLGPIGYPEARTTLVALAKTPSQALELSNAMRIALDGTHGTFDGVEVDLLRVDAESLDAEQLAPGGGSEDKDWVHTLEFEVVGRFREATV